MVARMMRWRPWPPLLSNKFQVKLVILRLEAPPFNQQPPAGEAPSPQESGASGRKRVMTAEVRWKGPKTALSSLRRPSVKRNCTRELEAVELSPSEEGGPGVVTMVEWDEEFQSVCCLTAHRDNAYHPWEIALSVFDSNEGLRNKSTFGTASLNLAEFASTAERKEIKIKIPLTTAGVSFEPPPSLYLSLSLLELRTARESSDMVQRSIIPAPLSPTSADTLPTEREELSALKAGLRKVKIFTDLVSTRKSKKTCREDEGSEGRCSARSGDAEDSYPFDTDSLDDDIDEGDLEDGKEDTSIRKSFSYGTLASANYLGGSFFSEMRTNGEYDDWIYYSHRRSDVGCSHASDMSSFVELSSLQTSKRSILPWRKRKLSFRSPKTKGEPLLKKAYGEEGGDDIDYDRRQLSSSDESLGRHKVDDDTTANQSSVSDFGDDNFTIGIWEKKDVVSRDGCMKICTQVFFASIDQRSERAAGQSACTALVAVIADWFQNNRDAMPIKSQFDSLIREGSFEWRNLCENEAYREHFPDKHFDLETVLQAKIRPLSVVQRKSFIGFFHPEGAHGNNSGFDFLHGAMSFDSIWDDISRAGSDLSDGSTHMYIVSWNDHFFLLKVEADAYYIIDTLGERLHEGCNQAYILKFDENTTICRVRSDEKPASGETGETGSQLVQQNIVKNDCAVEMQEQSNSDKETEEIVCRGKDSCKEYIKSFLAAIPIRELQADIKKGLLASTPIHRRLQIDFHYTELSKPMGTALPPAVEVVIKFPHPTLEPATSATSFTLMPRATELGMAVV